mmetsp:Transcript_23675/g.66126  ORF Transcript_23675/g.66126 Transcript_23675/m.66126 type:complete len:211 (+) Transcript_23675:455-1087(+)
MGCLIPDRLVHFVQATMRRSSRSNAAQMGGSSNIPPTRVVLLSSRGSPLVVSWNIWRVCYDVVHVVCHTTPNSVQSNPIQSRVDPPAIIHALTSQSQSIIASPRFHSHSGEAQDVVLMSFLFLFFLCSCGMLFCIFTSSGFESRNEVGRQWQQQRWAVDTARFHRSPPSNHVPTWLPMPKSSRLQSIGGGVDLVDTSTECTERTTSRQPA